MIDAVSERFCVHKRLHCCMYETKGMDVYCSKIDILAAWMLEFSD
jgi:hypothetical protein